MTRDERLAELRSLETIADAIRHELGINARGMIIFQAYRDAVEDEIVVVEADGFGAATTRIVAGNYPIDFSVKFEKFFLSEEEAETAAELVAFEGTAPSEILGEQV